MRRAENHPRKRTGGQKPAESGMPASRAASNTSQRKASMASNYEEPLGASSAQSTPRQNSAMFTQTLPVDRGRPRGGDQDGVHLRNGVLPVPHDETMDVKTLAKKLSHYSDDTKVADLFPNFDRTDSAQTSPSRDNSFLDHNGHVWRRDGTRELRDLSAQPSGSKDDAQRESILPKVSNDVDQFTKTSALQDLLKSEGSIDRIPEVHIYTMKYVEAKDHKVSNKCSKLLRDAFYESVMVPESFIALNQTTFLTLEPWSSVHMLDASSDLLDSATSGKIEERVFITQLTDAEHASLKDAKQPSSSLDGYTRLVSGIRSDGKPNWRWVKCDQLKVVSQLLPTQKSQYFDARAKAASEILRRNAPGSRNSDSFFEPRNFVLWFDHSSINLDDISNFVNEADEPISNWADVKQAIISRLLGGKLSDVGANQEGIVTSRSSAFVGEIQQTMSDDSGSMSVIPTALEKRQGLKGKFVFTDNGKKVAIAHKPSTAIFFKRGTVSDLIISLCGPTRAVNPDDPLMNKISLLLRGLEITIALKDGFGKETRIIQNLAQSAVRKPESIRGVKANVEVTDLRYPTMPLVDVGSSGRPFYFPAELCMIPGNQIFRGELPAVDVSLSSALHTKDKIIKSYTPKSGDPFQEVQPDDFRLFFATLNISSSANEVKAIRPEVWNRFQHEVGQRFDAKLSKSVMQSKKVKLDCSGEEEALMAISRFVRGSSGSKTALILAVNSTVDKGTVEAIRSRCETMVGIQVCFVNMRELEKRYHPAATKDMVMYTGQIVRKLFSRAKVPGKLEDDTTTANASSRSLREGRLFGIHVANVPDLVEGRVGMSRPFDLSRCFSVTIVSVSNKVNADSTAADDLLTTHHTLQVNNQVASRSQQVLTKIAELFAEHTKKVPMEDFEQSAVYVSGLPQMNEQDCEALQSAFASTIYPPRTEMASQSDSQSQDKSQPPAQIKARRPLRAFNLITMTSAKGVSTEPCLDRVDLRSISGAAGTDATDKPEFSTSELSTALRSDFALHNSALSRIFRHPRSSPGNDSSQKSSQMWHIMYQLSKEEKNEMIREHVPCLERHPLPDILHLADAASKRARSRIFLKSSSEDPHECPIGITAVHPALEGSLYYV